MGAAKHDTRCTRMIVAIIFSLFLPYTVAWVQRDATFLSSLSLSRLNPKPYPLRYHPASSGALQAHTGDDSLDLYRTVAEQDPEWYREFVLNVLGEDLLKNGEVGPKNGSKPSGVETDAKQPDTSEMTRSASNGSQSRLPKNSVEDPVDRNVDQSYKPSSNVDGKGGKSDNESSTGNIFQLPNYWETQPPSKNDKEAIPIAKAKQDLPQEVDQIQTELKTKPTGETPTAPGQTLETTYESNKVGNYSDRLEDKATGAIAPSAAGQEPNVTSNLQPKADRVGARAQDEANLKISISAALSSITGGTETEDLSKGLDLDRNEALAQDNADGRTFDPEAEARTENQGAIITGRSPVGQTAGETLTESQLPKKEEERGQGFTTKMSSMRDGDATTKGKDFATGVPSPPKTEPKELIEMLDQNRIGARTEEDGDARRLALGGERRTEAHEPNINKSAGFPIGRDTRQSPGTPEPSRQYGRDPTITAKASSEGEGIDVEGGLDLKNYVVIYRDLYTGTLQPVNLTSVTKLGYNINEIPYLQPDALALIVEDEIRRPSRGIPQQWQISQSQYEVLSDDVRIVPQEQAKELLGTANKKQRGKTAVSEEARMTPVEDHRSDLVDDDDDDEKERDHETGYGSGRPLAERKQPVRPQRPERPPSITSKDRRRRREDEAPTTQRHNGTRQEGKKRIYNAREIPRKASPAEEDDPPPPNSPVWVDIETFRNLLRKEAELRVRILGEDWANVVKEESNWRLRLYKEWLWALHHGIGTPLVPSRSDRARERTPKGVGDDKGRVDGAAPRRPRARPEGGGQPKSERILVTDAFDERIPVTDAFDETATRTPKRRGRTRSVDDIDNDNIEEVGDPKTRRKTITSERVMGDDVQGVPRRRRQAEPRKRETSATQKRAVFELENDMDDRSRRRIRRQPGLYDEADLPSSRRRTVAQDRGEDRDLRSRSSRTNATDQPRRRRRPFLEEYEEEGNEYDDDQIELSRSEVWRDDEHPNFRSRARPGDVDVSIPRRRKSMPRDNDDIQ